MENKSVHFGNRKDELLDLIHIKIHALRMMKGYKASQFEVDVNKLIAEEYKDNCKECREKLETLKNNPSQKKTNFFGELFKE